MKLIAKITVIFDRVLDVMFIIAGILLLFSMLSIGAAIASSQKAIDALPPILLGPRGMAAGTAYSS